MAWPESEHDTHVSEVGRCGDRSASWHSAIRGAHDAETRPAL